MIGRPHRTNRLESNLGRGCSIMPLVSTKQLVTTAYQNKFAVGAFNVGNSELVKNIIAVAEKLEFRDLRNSIHLNMS